MGTLAIVAVAGAAVVAVSVAAFRLYLHGFRDGMAAARELDAARQAAREASQLYAATLAAEIAAAGLTRPADPLTADALDFFRPDPRRSH